MSVKEQYNMKCPECDRDDALQVEITVMADLSDEGTEPAGDHEWDSDSFCRCNECGWSGKVKDAQAEFDAPEVLAYLVEFFAENGAPVMKTVMFAENFNESEYDGKTGFKVTRLADINSI